MSESEQKEAHVVWGIPVPRQENGRYKWPRAIKDKAVDRICGGEKIVSIAQEIGANQSLVAKWASNVRKDDAAQQGTGAFVEVVAAGDARSSIWRDTAATSCDVFLGDVRLTITPNYPTAHLTEILRAVRASQ